MMTIEMKSVECKNEFVPKNFYYRERVEFKIIPEIYLDDILYYSKTDKLFDFPPCARSAFRHETPL